MSVHPKTDYRTWNTRYLVSFLNEVIRILSWLLLVTEYEQKLGRKPE